MSNQMTKPEGETNNYLNSTALGDMHCYSWLKRRISGLMSFESSNSTRKVLHTKGSIQEQASRQGPPPGNPPDRASLVKAQSLLYGIGYSRQSVWPRYLYKGWHCDGRTGKEIEFSIIKNSRSTLRLMALAEESGPGVEILLSNQDGNTLCEWASLPNL